MQRVLGAALPAGRLQPGTRPPSLGSAEASAFWGVFLRELDGGEATWPPGQKPANLISLGPVAFQSAEFPHTCEVGEAYSPCSKEQLACDLEVKNPLLISPQDQGQASAETAR